MYLVSILVIAVQYIGFYLEVKKRNILYKDLNKTIGSMEESLNLIQIHTTAGHSIKLFLAMTSALNFC